MDFEIPDEIRRKLAELDAFIEREIAPLEREHLLRADGVDPRALVLLDGFSSLDERPGRDRPAGRVFIYALNVTRLAGTVEGIEREITLALEREIADFLGKRHCIVFSTGYQANLGMIAGLAGPKDTIYLDADSHSSIYDGCTLSRAQLVRFRHNDPEDLDRRLARAEPPGPSAA